MRYNKLVLDHFPFFLYFFFTVFLLSYKTKSLVGRGGGDCSKPQIIVECELHNVSFGNMEEQKRHHFVWYHGTT